MFHCKPSGNHVKKRLIEARWCINEVTEAARGLPTSRNWGSVDCAMKKPPIRMYRQSLRSQEPSKAPFKATFPDMGGFELRVCML